MDIQNHNDLLEHLQGFINSELSVTFTQWDGDGDDEEVSEFRAALTDVRMTDNEYEEKDLLLTFRDGEGESLEILMEIPKEEADLGVLVDGHLRIFGTEAEVVLTK